MFVDEIVLPEGKPDARGVTPVRDGELLSHAALPGFVLDPGMLFATLRPPR
jgi:hypothetical protein